MARSVLRAAHMLAPTLLLLSSLAPLAAPVPPPAALEPRAEADAYRALARISAGEPGIAEVQAAAGREADREAALVEGYPGRSRLSALLPRVTAEYHREERSYRVVGLQGSGEVDYLRFNPGSGFVLRATWDLSTLVAAPGEIAAASAASARAQRREAAVKRATAVYFERRRAMLALLLDPPPTVLARAEAELDVDRLTAELDALTGGRLAGGDRRR